jgi:pyridinium-3,5-biscarboxylic acid mononucleotide sulfurtransferase
VPVLPWRLARVERAEAAIRALIGDGLRDLRVRDLGDGVRVEVDAALVARWVDRAPLREAVAAAGFTGPVSVEPFRRFGRRSGRRAG